MFKYETIAEDIQSKILSGFYKPDEKLPQEMELCRQYGTSRITIRQAMELLVNRGLITKRRGSGTFVKAISGGSDNHESFARSQQFGGFTRTEEGKKITSHIHEFMLIPASWDIAQRLQLAEGSFVCYICRTRLADGKPHVVEYTYMPTDFITYGSGSEFHLLLYRGDFKVKNPERPPDRPGRHAHRTGKAVA